MAALTEIQYLPCIDWFVLLQKTRSIVIDDLDNFSRQTYRNRCYIAGANGKLPLIIPVENSRKRIPIKDVKISSTRWQREHWQSIRSAYGRAPYFEYYASEIEAVYRKKLIFLWEADWQFLQLLLGLANLSDISVILRSEYAGPEPRNLTNLIHPKKTSVFDAIAYSQTFAGATAFIPHLSLIDLLMNEGPALSQIIFSASKEQSSN